MKRLETPRIAPLSADKWTDDQRTLLEPVQKEGKYFNVLGTLAQHWEATQKLLVWAHHPTGETSTLPPRDRELLILRTAWLCKAAYEWGQHVVFGRDSGLTDDEIARVQEGPDAKGWTPFDAALIRAADELRKDVFITDDTWRVLRERYNTKQLMDVAFTVGQYTLMSICLNTFGVQLDQKIRSMSLLTKANQ